MKPSWVPTVAMGAVSAFLVGVAGAMLRMAWHYSSTEGMTHGTVTAVFALFVGCAAVVCGVVAWKLRPPYNPDRGRAGP